LFAGCSGKGAAAKFFTLLGMEVVFEAPEVFERFVGSGNLQHL
jgi:hypothetical protein